MEDYKSKHINYSKVIIFLVVFGLAVVLLFNYVRKNKINNNFLPLSSGKSGKTIMFDIQIDDDSLTITNTGDYKIDSLYLEEDMMEVDYEIVSGKVPLNINEEIIIKIKNVCDGNPHIMSLNLIYTVENETKIKNKQLQIKC